ncbi:coiled-coil domain-containing protein 180 [Discoglossus pictus]
MAMVGAVHVVPSGKVYRQIFDAEVQLVRSLGEARARAEQHGVSLDSGKIGLRDMDSRTAGLMSHNQSLWVDNMMYDNGPENQISYRESKTSTLKQTQESEEAIEAREVRGLCDVIVPEKRDSGLLQRIAANRHERHEMAVSDLQKDLADISRVEMESIVLDTGKNLQQKLFESDNKVELLYEQIENSDDSALNNKVLEDIWDEVTEESFKRRHWIKDTEKTLLEMEEKRTDCIAEVLKKYTQLLKEICFLMPADVDRLIHKESMMINQAILANHRAIAKLSVNLMESDLKKEGALRLRWQDLVKRWKSFQKEKIIQDFRNIENNEMSQIPRYVKEELDHLINGLSSLKEKRLHHLCSVSCFVPPTCTKAQVTEWYASLEEIIKQADLLNRQYLERHSSLEEEVCQKCISEAQKCKEQLSDMDICSKEEAEKAIHSVLFPLIEQFKVQFGNERETMHGVLENVSKQMDLQNKQLFRFCEKAVYLWEVLGIGLLQQETAMKQKLESCRQKNDGENQAKEAALDIILDKLRQESSQQQLRNTMGKALAALENIKVGYEKFYQEQVVIVDSYPEMVQTELDLYSSSVSKYFGVKEVYGQDPLPETDELEKEISREDKIPHREMPLHTLYSKVVVPSTGDSELDGSDETLRESHQDHEQSSQVFTGDGIREFPEQKNMDGFGVDDKQGDRQDVGFESGPDQSAHDFDTLGQLENISMDDESDADHKTLEFFTTSRGKTYTIRPWEQKEDNEGASDTSSVGEQSEVEQVFLTEGFVDETTPFNLDLITIPDNLFTELNQMIRLGFYEHLEHWFDETASNSHSVVIAKKEELKSELDLRYHLHLPRSQRIEMDIHNVRAAELLHHSERVDRHCAGVDKALNQLKNDSTSLIENMKQETRNFHSKIVAMEKTFLGPEKSDKLVALTKSLPSVLDSHVSGVQTVMRNYRQHVEEMLGKLCDTNSDFIKSFRLFSEGGNFSPDEVEAYSKKLHKASATIASFEGSIMVDLEGLESLCLEQATEINKKFEDKAQVLTTDKVFLENIQKLLTNLQVKIKSLVVDSNFQTKQINSHLEQIRKKTDACAHPNMDKEALTAEDLYSFVRSVMEEMSKRSVYLSCLLEPSPVFSKPPLQGPIAAASRQETPLRQDSKGTFGTPDSLLNPSRIGKLVLDDAAVSVIKNIMKSKHTGHTEREQGDAETRQPGTHQNPMIAPHPPNRLGSGTLNKKKVLPAKRGEVKQKAPAASGRKLIKPTRFDKKYQLFGEKKEESDNFKGILTSILFESNDTLLYLAEEFYKKKERRNFDRSKFLHESFEECADMLTLKLKSYEKQALEYHNSCLMEFQEQLEEFEKLVSQVPSLVIESHRRQHLESMQSSTEQIRQGFTRDLQKWDLTKEQMKSLLRPSLGHPENIHTLENLCQQEEKRQRQEEEGIENNTKCLQICVAEYTKQFTSSLASLSERLLLEMDDTLTVDDIIPAKTEIPKEKLSTLIRRKRDGLPLEQTEHHPLVVRGGRAWPGISLVDPENTNRSGSTSWQTTASVTTAKTTLSHVSTVEARDAAYLNFLQDTEVELAKILEDSTQQHFEAQRWKAWWTQSVLEIKQLYP